MVQGKTLYNLLIKEYSTNRRKSRITVKYRLCFQKSVSFRQNGMRGQSPFFIYYFVAKSLPNLVWQGRNFSKSRFHFQQKKQLQRLVLVWEQTYGLDKENIVLSNFTLISLNLIPWCVRSSVASLYGRGHRSDIQTWASLQNR